MSERIDRATLIADTLRARVREDPDLADVIVTLDPNNVPAQAERGVVIVRPPRLKMTDSYNVIDTEWDVLVIAGPPQDWLTAWARIDDILDAIIPGIAFTEGEPDTYGGNATRPGLPCYRLTYID